ncbi:toll/interleukin-1 receptor domain-containing protein [Piscinibacter sakaiensis]|uniref:toll/interleukin-1 receptor domain-containing protein n=1 Tax=Piscinibacter sakaiensis TaxID=1547922 RepID=UPI003AAD68C0
MSDVFISYSRRDQNFVRKLHQRLGEAGREAWVDWEGIPPSAEWLREVELAIEAADTFLFVLSPDSLASDICRHECEHAARFNKRIIPVVARPVDADVVPDPLRRINWLFFEDDARFDDRFATLLTTIDTDLDWVRQHSRLLVRAREWDAKAKDKSYLLAGTDLDAAERNLTASGERQPLMGPLQISYVVASRQHATELQRHQLRGFYIVSMVYSVLQTLVSYFVVFDEISETGLVYLSPIWVLGLVFGAYGLTFGKTSLKKSLIATGISAVLLYAFFIGLWPML